MDIVVLDILDIVSVSVMGKSTEPSSVQVNDERLVRDNENVNSHIKLFATDQ
jgi:hypothetical protein